jgi:hypothetical protein
MKTLTDILPRSRNREHFTVPRSPKLIGQWQRGIETMSGQALWKLRLTSPIRHHQPSQRLTTTNSHDRDVDVSNGNGDLFVWRIRRLT